MSSQTPSITKAPRTSCRPRKALARRSGRAGLPSTDDLVMGMWEGKAMADYVVIGKEERRAKGGARLWDLQAVFNSSDVSRPNRIVVHHILPLSADPMYHLNDVGDSPSR